MSAAYPTLTLKRGKEESLSRRHPWIFSGALYPPKEPISDGEKVCVVQSNGRVLATGHYGSGSIAVRVLAFAKCSIDSAFYTERIGHAYALRQKVGLPRHSITDAYRLVHGEGDGLPGLVIDIYRKVAVVQAHSLGMARDAPAVEMALRNVLGPALEWVVLKRADGARGAIDAAAPGYTEILENGHRFVSNWETGQKTGFFLDQRDNRALLAHYAAGKRFLNAFCYSGGFSIYAIAAGAALVHSLDSSEKALHLVQTHLKLNGMEQARHASIKADALPYLAGPEAAEANYDLIVLDPPAFAKHRSARHAAIQAYKRINAKAMEIIAPGGILFTFSCSQVVTTDLFENTIVAASIECGREVRILHRLQQPPDHPVSVYHPEGAYLKGLVLHVD
jgi:23S rRNA (cytosine1962-C5)-methyltransferase